MNIDDVIRHKGDATVVTIAPTASVAELVDVLSSKRIGALVVSADGERIDGIVSERDVVRGLAARGADVVNATVADIMTPDVRTVAPDDSVEATAHSMTVHRIRHMPIVVDGRMVGLVSIGDVVKHRIDQLTDERDQLIDYLHS